MLLGQPTSYPQTYDPSVLYPIPRATNREIHHIDGNAFNGADVWHAYEFSCLTHSGMPVAGVVKLIVPANSQHIVESKSLKLYLNSFNMTPMGATGPEASAEAVRRITRDISECLGNPVEGCFFDRYSPVAFDFSTFPVVEEMVSMSGVEIRHYTENPELLKIDPDKSGCSRFATHLLRSNCKVTMQPDWGSVFILVEGKYHPQAASFLQYIISLRNELHFHEEICELVFKRLHDKFAPEKLMVACIYTRRGGIDICPVRASHAELLPQNLISSTVLTEKLLRQ